MTKFGQVLSRDKRKIYVTDLKHAKFLAFRVNLTISILSQDEVEKYGWPDTESRTIRLVFEDGPNGFNNKVQADIIRDAVVAENGNILVHCFAGISRSPAIAGAISHLKIGNANWVDIAQQRQACGLQFIRMLLW